MKTKEFYVEENNSGGRTKVLCCSIEKPTKKKPYKAVKIIAKDIDEAIRKFEKFFKVDWEHENSFEGGSCNCCGRRFQLWVVNGDKEENDWGIRNIFIDNEKPYWWKDKAKTCKVIK